METHNFVDVVTIREMAKDHLTILFFTLLFTFFLWIITFKFILTPQLLKDYLVSIGIAVRRIARTIREMNRKTFHCIGLIIPTIYFFGLSWTTWLTKFRVTIVCSIVVSFYWFMEFLRWISPAFRQWFNTTFVKIMRDKEKNTVTGVAFYGLGVFCCIAFFPPLTAIAIFLVLGDATAAIVGISIGTIKIGHKTLEGTVSCFIVCFLIGILIFWSQPLPEYISFTGAMVSCLVELAPPFGLNDNFAIPVFCAMGINIAQVRLGIYR